MQIRILLVLVWGGALGVGRAEGQEAGAPALIEFAAGVFQTSDRCIACHSNLTAANGQDVSIGYAWRASMMANSARDPYWHAAVRREVMDHPVAQAAIEDKCSTCHMPIARFAAAHTGGQGQVFANLAAPRSSEIRHLAMDGVSCTVCHQIRADNFGEEASFDGGFVIDTTVPAELRNVFGPHDVDGGRQRVMQSAAGFLPTESTHVQQSELCATCHTLFTTALDSTGRTIGSLAEQVPYLEWLHSSYRATNNCQSCHMPELGQDTPISSVLGQARPNFSQHTFRGANAFMLGILNRFRGELGVAALPQELEASIRRTRDHLQTSAAVISIDAMRRAGPTLAVDVAVSSLTGHKLPTAYPSRRVWIHLSVLDARGNVLFESGRVRDDGSIVGNDNDDDGTRYEPHYRTIVSGDQVQIYEPILVDSSDRVTTGLLTGVRYIKDNRILPRGFDKATAEEEVAVKGAAAADDDFQAGGDRVRYEIPIGDAGVLTVEAELLYESIGYRWATNLSRYDADEPRRFTRYYAASSSSSAIALAHAARSSD